MGAPRLTDEELRRRYDVAKAYIESGLKPVDYARRNGLSAADGLMIAKRLDHVAGYASRLDLPQLEQPSWRAKSMRHLPIVRADESEGMRTGKQSLTLRMGGREITVESANAELLMEVAKWAFSQSA